MKEILNYLMSPAWWFSSVFVGIIITLVSSFVQKKIVSYFTNRSKKLLDKKLDRDAKDAEYVLKLVNKPELITPHLTYNLFVVITGYFCFLAGLIVLGTIATYQLSTRIKIDSESKNLLDIDVPEYISVIFICLNLFIVIFFIGLGFGLLKAARRRRNLIERAMDID